jgi:hypothetical protein
MTATVDRVWKGSLAILAEQVVRGVKPIATLAVVEARPGEVSQFMHEWKSEQPQFTRPLQWTVTFSRNQTIELVHLYTDDVIYSVYTAALALEPSDLRHAILGYLFGYDTDDILAYIRAKEGSKPE